jgi:hypothetical protein
VCVCVKREREREREREMPAAAARSRERWIVYIWDRRFDWNGVFCWHQGEGSSILVRVVVGVAFKPGLGDNAHD